MVNYDISGSTMPVYMGKSGFADVEGRSTQVQYSTSLYAQFFVKTIHLDKAGVQDFRKITNFCKAH